VGDDPSAAVAKLFLVRRPRPPDRLVRAVLGDDSPADEEARLGDVLRELALPPRQRLAGT
jgi:hypothetical protein